MDRSSFVETQIRHCLGAVAAPGLTVGGAARDHAIAASGGGAVLWLADQGRPDPLHGWQRVEDAADGQIQLSNPESSVNLEKHEGTLRAMLRAGLDFDVLIDMQDRRARQLRLADGSVFPTVSFHRHRDLSDRVIWPLPIYQDIGDANFLGGVDPEAVAWKDKIPRIAWRGIPGGRAQPKGPEGPDGYRLGAVFRKLGKGEWSEEKAAAVLSSFPRHRFVEQLYHDPRADVGLIDRTGFKMSKLPLLGRWARPRMTRQEMQGYRYLAVIRGNDLASNFFWTMNSGSLALVMDTPFESFAGCHFRPWEHYVPFKQDMSDFEAHFAWAEANPEECQAITRRAAEVCRLLADADLRDAALRGVVQGLSSVLGQEAGKGRQHG